VSSKTDSLGGSLDDNGGKGNAKGGPNSRFTFLDLGMGKKTETDHGLEADRPIILGKEATSGGARLEGRESGRAQDVSRRLCAE